MATQCNDNIVAVAVIVAAAASATTTTTRTIEVAAVATTDPSPSLPWCLTEVQRQNGNAIISNARNNPLSRQGQQRPL
jgi:hypothetical protein